MCQYQQVQRDQQPRPHPFIIEACGYAGQFGPGADGTGGDGPEQRQQPGGAHAAHPPAER